MTMYLATIHNQTSTRYQIRTSYPDADSAHFRHRLVFDLGENPRDHMEFIGDNAVYFSSELEHALRKCSDKDPDSILERLLEDFLPPEIRERHSRFNRSDINIPGPIRDEDRAKIESQIHIFDRRRLYYLYYRAIDQSKLFTMRESVFRQLFDQSRDEREFHFAHLEKRLEPGDYRNYLYAIFQLHRYFHYSFAIFLPEALPEARIADHFVDELCTLNSSPSFWQTGSPPHHLHPHLVRYLIMFFDYTPKNRLFENDFVRQFINSHRTFRWPERKPDLQPDRILEIFGQSWDELKKMSGKELSRLYRKKAMLLHPDQGGEQEKFVELTEMYGLLMKQKP